MAEHLPHRAAALRCRRQSAGEAGRGGNSGGGVGGGQQGRDMIDASLQRLLLNTPGRYSET